MRLGGVNALVVDDDYHSRELLRAILNKLGASVETAEDGEQALEKIEGNSFDLITCDWNMPNLTGEELLRRVRSLENEGRSVIFVMVTCRRQHEDVLKVCQDVDGYIAKPFNTKQLADRLIELVCKTPNHTAQVQYYAQLEDNKTSGGKVSSALLRTLEIPEHQQAQHNRASEQKKDT